jgi:deoxyribonuclease-4
MRALELGCETFQIFTRNQRQWYPPPISENEIRDFRSSLSSSGLGPVLVHASYLINTASDDRIIRSKSVEALKDEVSRCELLGLEWLVIHPGSHKGRGEEHGVRMVASAIDEVIEGTAKVVTILLETTAGQGSGIGHSFDQLSSIMDSTSFHGNVGVCLDTCHMHAAGYDLSTRKQYDETMDMLEDLIGISNIKGIHLNDSKKGLGERIDRHENIGEGTIGAGTFSNLLNDRRLKDVPMVLETPGGNEGYKKDLHFLRGLVRP